MPKNIVVCCDGTGNEIGNNISNVLKLYRILEKNDQQRVYYNPGVGTIGQQNAWQRFKQKARGVFGLITGYGLDDDVLGAYRFICQVYDPGDRVWLFGFSRGAYTVRVLAAFIHVIGLLKNDQLNLAGYAFSAYKISSHDRPGSNNKNKTEKTGSKDENGNAGLEGAWHFSRVAGGSDIRLEFIGVWDTVASVIVPHAESMLLGLQTLRFTRTNPCVKTFRQAIAIDERRRMFRLNAWTEKQIYRPTPFKPGSDVPQDVRQVWFAGVHADIGGGYAESESGLSKFPLHWMVDEAHKKGLLVNRAMVNHLVLGRPRKGSKHQYVKPDSAAMLHVSMTAGWTAVEWLPKKARWQEWAQRRSFLGWYLPRSEPRVLPEGAIIHRSVIERIRLMPSYRPINLPREYCIEESFPQDDRRVDAP